MKGWGTILTLVLATLLACSPPRLDPGQRPDSQLITQEEIDASRATNAFEVIRKLRANFLAYRGDTSLDRAQSRPYPTVYLDGQEFGSIETLRTIPASQISSIRLLRGSEATTRYGAANTGGVIEITTR